MAVTILPAAQVVYSPNPLRPAADRETRNVALAGGDTVRGIIDRMGLGNTVLAVTLNGRVIPRDLLSTAKVSNGDMIVIRQAVAGVEASKVAAWAIMQLEVGATAAAVIGATVSFAVGAAIAFVATTILGSLTARGPSSTSGSNDDSPTAYSIEGGSNGARPYAPHAIILGRHRVFPDYGSRPFGEFILDPSTTTEVINSTPQTVQQVPPEFGFSGVPPEVDEPWALIRSDANYDYYGDNAVRSYVTTDGPVTRPHTFVVRHSTAASSSEPDQATTYEQFIQADSPFLPPQWLPLDTPQPVITRYGYTVTYKTEQLVSIFNYGFGDLTVSDRRLGANELTQYNAVQLDVSSVPPGHGERTQLIGYSSPNWPSDSYPSNVQTVEGGSLEQHANVVNDGWIERQGSIAARFVQIDITGRLLRQEAGNIANLSCDFQAEYQTPGGSTWVPFPFSPMTITNGSTRIVRETFSANLDQPAAKVRVRRTTVEPTDANQVSELQLTRIKFFRDGDALYPAQRREGLVIRATGQLNGQVDRLSALVEMKCWVWASSQPWDGSMPGVGRGAWVWQPSVNPGFLYLYYARGGFLNSTAAPAHLGLAGWLDEPSPTNGERIFGAGLVNADIDYGTLIAWAQWCAVQQLECHLSLTDVKSVFTVLNTIAAAGRARMSWAPGKLSVWWEAAGQPSTAAFGASNIVAGTFKIAYDTDESIDGFVMSYTRVDDDYQPDEVRATLPGVTQPINWQSVDAAYSMPRGQAQRLVNLLAAAKHYFRRSISWESTAFGLTVATGDVIQLAHDLTRWAHSGRLVAVDVAGDHVRSVTLSAEVEAVPGDGEFWLMVTPPGSEPISYRCARPAARTRTLQLVDLWPADSAPGWLDAATPNDAASAFYDDTVPEDWTWLAGPAATPGKRVRIIGTEPSSDRRVRITARDEVAEYYPLEWGLGNVPSVSSGERIVARLFNLAATRTADGGQRVTWELEGAVGADVRVAISGGPEQQVPIAGQLTVVGSDLLLPAYAPGTHLHIRALPVAAGTPAAIEGDAVDFVAS